LESEAQKKYNRNYREENREKINAYAFKYRQEHKEKAKAACQKCRKGKREQVINHYGGECECCGENTFEFLAIDHINGNGCKHRKSIGSASRMIKWLMENNYPEGFRILCHNCNSAIGFYGHCPHKKDK